MFFVCPAHFFRNGGMSYISYSDTSHTIYHIAFYLSWIRNRLQQSVISSVCQPDTSLIKCVGLNFRDCHLQHGLAFALQCSQGTCLNNICLLRIYRALENTASNLWLHSCSLNSHKIFWIQYNFNLHSQSVIKVCIVVFLLMSQPPFYSYSTLYSVSYFFMSLRVRLLVVFYHTEFTWFSKSLLQRIFFLHVVLLWWCTCLPSLSFSLLLSLTSFLSQLSPTPFRKQWDGKVSGKLCLRLKYIYPVS